MRNLIIGMILLIPCAASAQDHWTGIGAIGQTAMYMDTTTIVRDGTLRKAWIKSVDSEPKVLAAGKDTIRFDTVIGLNVFDCSNRTYTVESVQYFYADESTLSVPTTKDTPKPIRPKSFFDAVYGDLCSRK